MLVVAISLGWYLDHRQILWTSKGWMWKYQNLQDVIKSWDGMTLDISWEDDHFTARSSKGDFWKIGPADYEFNPSSQIENYR
jgi:hypothetical protein